MAAAPTALADELVLLAAQGDRKAFDALTALVKRYPRLHARVKRGLLAAAKARAAQGAQGQPDAIEAAVRANLGAVVETIDAAVLVELKTGAEAAKAVAALGEKVRAAYLKAVTAPAEAAVKVAVAELRAAGFSAATLAKTDLALARALGLGAWSGSRGLPPLEKLAASDRRRVERIFTYGLARETPVEEMAKTMQAVVGGSQAKAYTIVNTHYQAVAREVIARKGEALAGAIKVALTYQYTGPLDGRTRPFCRREFEHVHTREEIDALDNGQGLPVWTFGGGYNCRHRWRLVVTPELLAQAGNLSPEQEAAVLAQMEVGSG